MTRTIGYNGLILIGILLWASIQAMAFDPGANENLILFDADGQVTGTFHLHDFTSTLSASGSDYKVESEDYTSGPLSIPDLYSTLIPSAGSTYAVPNLLGKTYPSPPPDVPQVSLFSFDDAIFASATPTTPGISFSPSPGTYSQTITVSITASPASATISYSKDRGATFIHTSQNKLDLYIYKSTDLVLQARHTTMGDSTPKDAFFLIVRDTEENPEMVDSDSDGIPDSWEVLHSRTHGFNPLESDREKDMDNDGVSDFREILSGFDPDDPCVPKICLADIESSLSGADPATKEDLALLATIGSLHPDYDFDGDGWSDWDEKQLRGTLPEDATDKPTARRLNEVERKLSGIFYDADLTPVPGLNFRISSFGSTILAQGVSDSTGTYAGVRIPVGEPAVIRGAGLPASQDPEDPVDPLKNLILKRYVPVTKDLMPQDMPGTWNSAIEWEKKYLEFLAANLVEDITDFDVRSLDYYPLAILERELEILENLEAMEDSSSPYLLLGSKTHIPAFSALIDMETRLTLRQQTMNDHLKDVTALIASRITACTALEGSLFSDADDRYQDWTSEDEKTIEQTIASLFQDPEGRYLAGLMMNFTWAQLEHVPAALCDILNFKADLDADSLINEAEVPTPEIPSGNSSPFLADTDSDTVNDAVDNCPAHFNPDQKDWDTDGTGDVCDPDKDNDGLDNGTESAFGSNPFDTDSDDDGIFDLDEWRAYSDPGIAIVLTQVTSPTKLSFQTIGGTLPLGVTQMSVTLNDIAQGPVAFLSSATTWTCPIIGINFGNNDVLVYAKNAATNQSGYTTATIVNTAAGDICEGNTLGNDADVDGEELALFAAEFGRKDCSQLLPCTLDINHDGRVDKNDLILFLEDFGRMSCP